MGLCASKEKPEPANDSATYVPPPGGPVGAKARPRFHHVPMDDESHPSESKSEENRSDKSRSDDSLQVVQVVDPRQVSIHGSTHSGRRDAYETGVQPNHFDPVSVFERPSLQLGTAALATRPADLPLAVPGHAHSLSSASAPPERNALGSVPPAAPATVSAPDAALKTALSLASQISAQSSDQAGAALAMANLHVQAQVLKQSMAAESSQPGSMMQSPFDRSITQVEPMMLGTSVEEIRAMVASANERVNQERATSQGQARMDAIVTALEAKTGTMTLRETVKQFHSRFGQSAHTLLLGSPNPMPYVLNRDPPVYTGSNGVVAPLTAPNGNRLIVKFFRDRATLNAEVDLLESRKDIAKLVPQVFDWAYLTDEGSVGVPEGGQEGATEEKGGSAEDAVQRSENSTVTPFATGYIISARGNSLAALMQSRNYADTSFPMELFMKITSILRVLHSARRIHGNLTPRHIIVIVDHDEPVPEFLISDLSCSRTYSEGYAPWGTFDIRFAAPELVEAALNNKPIDAEPASDVWSFGMVLHELTAGKPYWPRDWNDEDVVEALLGRRPLPHLADPNLLCGRFRTKIRRMLQPKVTERASLAEMMREAAQHVEATVTRVQNGSLDENKFASMLKSELLTLKESISLGFNDVGDRVNAVGGAVDAGRVQMGVMHRLMIGQQISATLQLWRPVAGKPNERRLCPISIGSTAAGADGSHAVREKAGAPLATTAPIFQLVQGEEYYVTLLIQNRDLSSPVDLPFEAVKEIRILPKDHKQALRVYPKILEHTEYAWWGEGSWMPTESGLRMFQDCTQSSNKNPGECKVYIYLQVPHMETHMRLSRRLLFNMHPQGTNLAPEKYYAAVVDFFQNPQTAKKEMMKTGLQIAGVLGRYGATGIGKVVMGI